MNVPEKKDNAARKANFISAINVLVAATLAVFTYLLFDQATKDSTTADKAANAAIEAVKEQKRNDSISQIAQEKSYIEDSIKNRKIFISDSVETNRINNLDNTTRQNQINSLKEAKREFEASAKPFIQITNMEASDSIPNRIKVKYEFRNLNNYSAKFIYTVFNRFYGYTNNLNDSQVTANSKKLYFNTLLSNGGAAPFEIDEPVDDTIYKRVENGRAYLYIVNQFEYISLVNDKKYFTKSIFRIRFKPKISIEQLVNDFN